MPGRKQHTKVAPEAAHTQAPKAEPAATDHAQATSAEIQGMSFGAAPSPAAHAIQLSRLSPPGAKRGAARLQRAYGNQYMGEVSAHAAPLVVQPKLTVTPPNDQYEAEADRVAGQVMRQIQSGSAPLRTRTKPR